MSGSQTVGDLINMVAKKRSYAVKVFRLLRIDAYCACYWRLVAVAFALYGTVPCLIKIFTGLFSKDA